MKYFLSLFLIFVYSHSFAVDSFSIDLGNDLWTGMRSDRYFTNMIGIHLQTKELPEFLKTFLPDIEADHFITKISQDMYTPEDIEAENPDPNDRPYAGHLYVEIRKINISNHYHDYTTLQVGIIGPASMADKAQTLVHEWTGSRPANGWKAQLKNELGLNMQKLIGYKTDLYRNGLIRISNITYGQAAFGNVKISAGVGTLLTAGYNPPQNDSMYDVNTVQSPSSWSVYVESNIRGNYVVRDMFIDGNTPWFGDKTQLEREEYVTTMDNSFVVRFRQFFLRYTQTMTSKQFKGQNGDHNFGKVFLEWRSEF